MGDMQKHTVMMSSHQETYTTSTGPAISMQARLNRSYIRSIGALLTIIELVLCIIVIICIGSTNDTSYAGIGFGIFVAVCGLILGGAVLGIRLFDFHENISQFPWALFWVGAHALIAVCFFIAGAICIAAADNAPKRAYYFNNDRQIYTRDGNNRVRDGCAAAVFFAWIAAILYGFHAFLYFKGYRANTTIEVAPFALPWEARMDASERHSRPMSTPAAAHSSV